jgi:hypothetical protein
MVAAVVKYVVQNSLWAWAAGQPQDRHYDGDGVRLAEVDQAKAPSKARALATSGARAAAVPGRNRRVQRLATPDQRNCVVPSPSTPPCAATALHPCARGPLPKAINNKAVIRSYLELKIGEPAQMDEDEELFGRDSIKRSVTGSTAARRSTLPDSTGIPLLLRFQPERFDLICSLVVFSWRSVFYSVSQGSA